MECESEYFTLSLESLRAIGGWAADCAERALSLFEARAGSDGRPLAVPGPLNTKQVLKCCSSLFGRK